MNLLRLFKKESVSYYGNQTYKQIEKLLRNERDLMIVSPYIDAYYADYLVRHSRGKNIYVISSSIKSDVARRFRARPVHAVFVLVFFLVVLDLLSLSLAAFSQYVLLTSAVIAAASIAFLILPRSRIHLKTPRRFVHAKMYLGNGSAIEGSANLTYAGTHKNLERINVISDPEKIEELRRQFWQIWNSLN